MRIFKIILFWGLIYQGSEFIALGDIWSASDLMGCVLEQNKHFTHCTLSPDLDIQNFEMKN